MWQQLERITCIFEFPLKSKIIYTTNLMENLNGKNQKIHQNKMSFPTDDAVLKSVFLCLKRSYKKWSTPIQKLGYCFKQRLMLILTKGSDYKSKLTFNLNTFWDRVFIFEGSGLIIAQSFFVF